MGEFDQIWSFVEEKLNVEVPTYVKNITHACGFDNGIALASIDKDDIEYFVEQTRNGNVKKFFANDEIGNVLKGTAISEKEFEFTRGHSKLLLCIVDYLKQYMEENGPNKFTSKAAKKNTSREITKNSVPKTRFTPREVRLHSRPLDLFIKNNHEFPTANLKIQEGILLSNAIMSLINFSPELYCKNIGLIKIKILNELVMVRIAVETEDNANNEAKVQSDKKFTTSEYEAVIGCPYCEKTIDVLQTSSLTWNTTNFDHHLEAVHFEFVPTQTIRSDANDKVVAAIPENTIDHIENDNIKIDDHKKMDDVLPKTKVKKQRKEKQRTSMTSKSKSLLPENTKETIADGTHSKRLSVTKVDETLMKPGDYVICSTSIKSSIKWPANKPEVKNFVGQIRLFKERTQNEDTLDEIEIQLLSKSPYSKLIFKYPENIDITHVPRKEIKIFHILKDPSQNRRGELVFDDKILLDYTF